MTPAPECTVSKIRIEFQYTKGQWPKREKWYFVTLTAREGFEIRMSPGDLQSAKMFRRRVLEQFNQIVDKPSDADLNILLSEAVRDGNRRLDEMEKANELIGEAE